MRLIIGTTKGLITYTLKNKAWHLTDVAFKGLPISMIHYQKSKDLWWTALAIKHWGPKLFVSSDQGTSWTERSVPKYPTNAMVRPDTPATLKLIWCAGHCPATGRLWLGTEPGGLFYTDDEAHSFTLVDGLWNHESRPDHWFGGGRNDAGIHSIRQHPTDPNILYIGVSCAGVFKSTDGGINWIGKNKGLHAAYLPDPHSSYGHDPHALEICTADPNVIWQQNHCGIFVSRDGANTWTDVTPVDQYGRYGFPIVIDHDRPGTAWIIPAESDEQRVAKDLRLVVCRTDDFGKTWFKETNGLPQENCFDLVFRHSFAKHDHLMAFGTTTGNLFISNNRGEKWMQLSDHLPPIHSVILSE